MSCTCAKQVLCVQVDIRQSVAEYQLTPLNMLLRNVLDQLQQRDAMGIFAEPVSREEVCILILLSALLLCVFVLLLPVTMTTV